MNEWNRNDLTSFLENGGNGLLYFYTPMCGTCQLAGKMLKVIKEIARIDMGKMNLNFYPDLAMDFGIESVPCLLFIRGGEVTDTLYAFRSVPYLLEKINEHFG
ncbi:thioredoxin [Bacillus sp. X1(2014)]|nr:thioredoxin [Bacillus sp. X1(2014)]